MANNGSNTVTLYHGQQLTIVFDNGAPLNATVRYFGPGFAPWIEIDQRHSPEARRGISQIVLHIREVH